MVVKTIGSDVELVLRKWQLLCHCKIKYIMYKVQDWDSTFFLTTQLT
jgi:hypothetical protein